jgi:hypothetical protein
VSAHPPHDLVRAVRAELATPGRYQLELHSREQRSLLRLALQWLADRYADFLHALEARVHVGPSGVSLFGDVLIVIAVIVLGVIGARLLIAFQLERAQRARALEVGPARSAYAIARAASQAAAAGAYAQAIRLLFAAAVTLLDLRGVVHDDAGATINELQRELRARQSGADQPFAALARMYTAAAYAEDPLDASSWQRAREEYDRLGTAISAQ